MLNAKSGSGRRRLLLSALAAPALLPRHGLGQSWPSRPIRVVVPYAAGGTTDLITRLVTQHLAEHTGRSFVVDNRPGGGGVIGSTEVARAAPDGTTLLLGAPNSFSINQFMFRRLGYSPERDLTGIALIGQVPNVLMINPSLVPARNVADFIAFARARPGQLSGGSGGVGTSGHLSLELFKVKTGLDILHVPYHSSGQARADLLAGRCQMAIDNLTSYIGDVERGSILALATGTAEPTRFLPGVPTLAASGLEGYASSAWYALAAPTGTPAEMIETLGTAVNAILRLPAFIERSTRIGVEVLGGTPAQANAFFAAEAAKWKVVVEAARAVLDQ
jgi:tripartite-type tricarboxylate transporter receptor subunit TctC